MMPRQTCLPLPLPCLVSSAISGTNFKYIEPSQPPYFSNLTFPQSAFRASNQMPATLISAHRHLNKSRIHLNQLTAYVYIRLAMQIGLGRAKEVTLAVYNEVQRTRVLNLAAGLSDYFLLSLFPLLIVLATLLGYLPIPNLFNQSMDFAARFVPSEAMDFVRRILPSVLTPNRGGLLSIGLIGTLWATSREGGLRPHLIRGSSLPHSSLQWERCPEFPHTRQSTPSRVWISPFLKSRPGRINFRRTKLRSTYQNLPRYARRPVCRILVFSPCVTCRVNAVSN